MTTLRNIEFNPAYSGGIFYTGGVSIPEGITIGKEYYPTGAQLPVVVDLETVQLLPNIPILFNHDAGMRIGHTESMETDGKSIVGKGFLDSNLPWVEEVSQSYQKGARWQCSIGTGLIDVAMKTLIPAGESAEVNGQQIPGPFTLLKNAMVREISIVPAGADPQAEILLSTLTRSKSMTFEEFAASKGFDLAALDEKNRAALEAIFNESQTTGDATLTASEECEGEPKEGLAASEGEEPKEEEGLTASEGEEPKKEEEGLTASEGEEEPKKEEGLTAGLRRSNTSTRKFTPSLNAPAANRSFGTSEPAKRSEVLQCSALLGLGVPSDWLRKKGGFSSRCVDIAEREESATLLSMMGETLHASGFRVDYRNPRAIVENYRELFQGSAVSTKSFGNINVFSPIIDKQMRYKYERLESIWSKLFRARSVTDFNKVATVNLDVQGRAKDLAENEDYPEILLKSDGEEFAVSKQGVVGAISFESQINDDMGALDIISDELLNLIVDVQTDKFWSLFWSRFSTNYTAARGNKITKKLSVAGLSAAKKAFMSKKNANGRFINVPAKHLLVPSALEDSALHLFEWKWGESNMSGNIHVGKYDVWTDPYLGTEGGYTGASDTGWFMLGDVSRYPLGEYATLKGFESPKIKETWYDHKDALNMRALGTIGFHAYTDNLAAVYSDGTTD